VGDDLVGFDFDENGIFPNRLKADYAEDNSA
jgi:hypothetical protein